jgi:AbrB family looped-hinge helix DNA binding protein
MRYYFTRVTRKGQVTIPKIIRDQLGVTGGSEVGFGYRDGEAVLVKQSERDANARIRDLRSHLEHVRGTGRTGLTSSELMDMTRGPYDDIDNR